MEIVALIRTCRMIDRSLAETTTRVSSVGQETVFPVVSSKLVGNELVGRLKITNEDFYPFPQLDMSRDNTVFNKQYDPVRVPVIESVYSDKLVNPTTDQLVSMIKKTVSIHLLEVIATIRTICRNNNACIMHNEYHISDFHPEKDNDPSWKYSNYEHGLPRTINTRLLVTRTTKEVNSIQSKSTTYSIVTDPLNVFLMLFIMSLKTTKYVRRSEVGVMSKLLDAISKWIGLQKDSIVMACNTLAKNQTEETDYNTYNAFLKGIKEGLENPPVWEKWGFQTINIKNYGYRTSVVYRKAMSVLELYFDTETKDPKYTFGDFGKKMLKKEAFPWLYSSCTVLPVFNAEIEPISQSIINMSNAVYKLVGRE